MKTAQSSGEAKTVRFSLITTVYDPPPEVFEDTVSSVLAQSHDDWAWVLVDDCSRDPSVRERLARLAAADPRISVHLRTENGGIAAASQDALARARGEFVVLLDHDDMLTDDALATIETVVADRPDVDYVYSDLDRMSEAGRTHSRFRKPDWSPERLRHHNYVNHLSVLRRSLVIEVGGFRPGYDGSQDHDLVLRVTERARAIEHVPRVLYHWREIPGSAARDPEAKPWAWEAGVRAVQDHLDRTGIKATASTGRSPGTYDILREPDLSTPTSVVITGGMVPLDSAGEQSLLTETVRSVLSTSTHKALELILMVSAETPVPVLEELDGLSSTRRPVRLFEVSDPSNMSRARNLGAVRAQGDNLVFLSERARISSDGGIEQLVTPLNEPGVGGTGAKLLFGDDRVQHAGLVYGSGAIARTYYRMAPDHLGAYGDLWSNREVTALPAACLAIRHDIFEEAGGFCEDLPAHYNDLDLSLKVRREGRRLVWLHSVLVHHVETETWPPDAAAELALIQRRWGDPTEVRERFTTDVDFVVRAHKRWVRR